MHCTLQYTIDTKKYSIKLFNSSYVWSICSQKMTFSTRKSGIPLESSGIPPESSGISPGISGIPFFKFEFTFRSENAVFGGISSGIPFPVIGGICKKTKRWTLHETNRKGPGASPDSRNFSALQSYAYVWVIPKGFSWTRCLDEAEGSTQSKA